MSDLDKSELPNKDIWPEPSEEDKARIKSRMLEFTNHTPVQDGKIDYVAAVLP